jgi:glycerol-3-phosphate responsive antiterminator
MENKQTAVEFLEEKYRPKGYITTEEFAQAKEMEKQQIIDAWNNQFADDNIFTAEQYYKQKHTEVINDNN